MGDRIHIHSLAKDRDVLASSRSEEEPWGRHAAWRDGREGTLRVRYSAIGLY